MSKLINYDSNSPGIFRVIIIFKLGDDKSRIYIPGIQINPLNSDGTLNESVFNANIDTYPLAVWNSKPMRDAIPYDIILSGWITYEVGDTKRPIIMGYLGNSLLAADEWSGSSGGGNGSDQFYTGNGQGKELVGGRIVDALFTAYYPTSDGYSSAENRLQGGPTSATGETLDYTKFTCAVPHTPYVDKSLEIAYGTNIMVMDTGSSQDGIVYRANDCGSAITVENGVYHFDLLMKDRDTAYAWGRRNGKAMIGGTLKEKAISGNGININGWIYPLSQKHTLNPTTDGRAFGASRSNGARAHAGIDLIVPPGVKVYSCTDGIVDYIDNAFYAGTACVVVKNKDGSWINYGEISSNVRVGQSLKKGDVIGTVKANNSSGASMLHFETYIGDSSGNVLVNNGSYKHVPQKTYKRRCDLSDPTFVINLPMK